MPFLSTFATQRSVLQDVWGMIEDAGLCGNGPRPVLPESPGQAGHVGAAGPLSLLYAPCCVLAPATPDL